MGRLSSARLLRARLSERGLSTGPGSASLVALTVTYHSCLTAYHRRSRLVGRAFAEVSQITSPADRQRLSRATRLRPIRRWPHGGSSPPGRPITPPAGCPRTNRNGRTSPPRPRTTLTVTEVCVDLDLAAPSERLRVRGAGLNSLLLPRADARVRRTRLSPFSGCEELEPGRGSASFVLLVVVAFGMRSADRGAPGCCLSYRSAGLELESPAGVSHRRSPPRPRSRDQPGQRRHPGSNTSRSRSHPTASAKIARGPSPVIHARAAAHSSNSARPAQTPSVPTRA